MMAEVDAVKGVLGEYVRWRRADYDRAGARQQIDQRLNALTAADQRQVMELLRRWEAHETRTAAPAAADPYQTALKPPAGLRVDAPSADRPRGIRRLRAAPRSTTSQVPPQTILCPDCGATNAADELYCLRCGLLLHPLPGARTVRDETQRLVHEPPIDTAHFDDDSVLVLLIPGYGEIVRARVRRAELMIGRRSAEGVMIPDIDLAPYQADVKGVSRLHAAIRRQDDTLVLTDLDSLNYTFINGQRVHAQEVRVLHDGDELRLGQLVLHVRFERA